MAEIAFTDEKLCACIEAWLEEIGAKDFPDEDKQILSNAFRAGWANSIQQNLAPAVDLCLVFLRLASIATAKGDYKLVLSKSVIDLLVDKCKAVVGDADMEALSQYVEVAEIDDGEDKD